MPESHTIWRWRAHLERVPGEFLLLLAAHEKVSGKGFSEREVEVRES